MCSTTTSNAVSAQRSSAESCCPDRLRSAGIPTRGNRHDVTQFIALLSGAAGRRSPDNTRSFRHTLLMRRDGARLHAGSTPTGDLDRIRRKMDFLIASGVPERDAQMAMLAAGRFTIGSVLEEQADSHPEDSTTQPADMPAIDHDSAFEAGLTLILNGLTHRTGM
ncbi:TetR/AcrR family transcriptional regulator C-terminal domain-containing protein [Streptomyces violascens]|uniref:TetR/AcrR family transcriptional regulator C-terminal domain-containing protein n=1 Tax=Streptomyces violascens TaxID=67381 RepID=UPI00364CFBE8